MNQSIEPQRQGRLEQAAHILHRGKNWIISHALEDYLTKISHTLLAEEARRQSILASAAEPDEDAAGEQSADEQGWV